MGEEDMWTDFLEKINNIMLAEKKARQESDHNKGAELCKEIVSILNNENLWCEVKKHKSNWWQ